MKNNYLISLFTLIFLSISFISNASHYMGGEVTYEYLDNNGPVGNPFRYRVKFDIYIYCGVGSNYPNGDNGQISFGVFDGVNGNLISPNDNVNGVTRYTSDLSNALTNVTPNVPAACDDIPGITDNCIVLNTYETIINLPFNNNGFLIAHERCCRNGNINNLLQPGDQGHALYSYIPSPINNNSSPQFTTNAIPALCIGDTVSIINNAFDPDGDILQYEFIAPPTPNIANMGGNAIPNMAFVGNYQVPTTTLPYVSGYNVNEPFGPGSYAFIDASTGLTQYMALNAGNYVVVVEIKEYRNIGGTSVLLSTTRRDIQFIVSDQCEPNLTPEITSNSSSSGGSSSTTNFINIEEGESLQIVLNSTDADLDNVNLTASGPILDAGSGYTGPLATFNINSAGDEGIFDWQTECGMRGSYQVNISSQDNGCPPKTLNQIYTINILPFNAKNIVGPDSVCFLDDVSTFFTSAPNTSTFDWEVLNGSISNYNSDSTEIEISWGVPGNGRIDIVETSEEGCKDSTFKIVRVRDAEIINADRDTSLCKGDSVPVTASGTSEFLWSPNQFVLDPNSASTFVFPDTTTDFIVSSKSNLCFKPDTIRVIVNEHKTETLKDTTCMRDSIIIGAPSIFGFTYDWETTLGLNNPTIAQPMLSLDSAGTFVYIVNIVDTNQCKGVDSVEVLINPTPDSINIVGGNSICPNSPGINYLTDDTSIVAFVWSIDGGNLVNGQGSDSIIVDWGIANPSASVNVVPENVFGCVGDTNRYPVVINEILQIQLPDGPDSLCFFDKENLDYSIPLVNGSNYTWTVSTNGIINTGQSTEEINVDWLSNQNTFLFVEDSVKTISTVCLGKSDTLFVRINPSPDTTLSINGNFDLCSFSDTIGYNLSGLVNSSFVWVLDSGGTIINGQGSSAIDINWDSTGTYPISVLETSEFGCVGRSLDTTITVRSIPITSIDTNAYQFKVCQNLDSIYYQVDGFANSTYTWKIIGGDSITENTSGIYVNWDESPIKELMVVETSEYNCVGDTFKINVLYDPSNVNLVSVSDQFEDESLVELNWNTVTINDTLTDDLILFRKEANALTWDSIASISRFETSYIDGPLSTSDTKYQYYLSTSNICLDTLSTLEHDNIVLKGLGDEVSAITVLSWNQYQDWSRYDGVKEYNIYRNLDGNGYELYESTSDLDSVIEFTNGGDGFKHCYRIEAIQELDNEVISWSNETCVDYMHDVIVYNALTPNGDGKNDYFHIKNVWLYPDSYVEIYNRWGNLVYQKSAYNNEWDGGNLPDGTYYYVVKITHNGEQLGPFTGDLLLQR